MSLIYKSFFNGLYKILSLVLIINLKNLIVLLAPANQILPHISCIIAEVRYYNEKANI